MPQFIFHLDGVLTQRKHIERERQREAAVLGQQVGALETELKMLNSQVVSATDDLRRNHLVGPIDLSFLAAHRRYIAAVQRKGVGMMQRLALLQKQVLEARMALQEAAKQRKVIEKLREKHHERWRADLSRKELAEQDDTNMRLSYFMQESDT